MFPVICQVAGILGPQQWLIIINKFGYEARVAIRIHWHLLCYEDKRRSSCLQELLLSVCPSVHVPQGHKPSAPRDPATAYRRPGPPFSERSPNACGPPGTGGPQMSSLWFPPCC